MNDQLMISDMHIPMCDIENITKHIPYEVSIHFKNGDCQSYYHGMFREVFYNFYVKQWKEWKMNQALRKYDSNMILISYSNGTYKKNLIQYSSVNRIEKYAKREIVVVGFNSAVCIFDLETENERDHWVKDFQTYFSLWKKIHIESFDVTNRNEIHYFPDGTPFQFGDVEDYWRVCDSLNLSIRVIMKTADHHVFLPTVRETDNWERRFRNGFNEWKEKHRIFTPAINTDLQLANDKIVSLEKEIEEKNEAIDKMKTTILRQDNLLYTLTNVANDNKETLFRLLNGDYVLASRLEHTTFVSSKTTSLPDKKPYLALVFDRISVTIFFENDQDAQAYLKFLVEYANFAKRKWT